MEEKRRNEQLQDAEGPTQYGTSDLLDETPIMDELTGQPTDIPATPRAEDRGAETITMDEITGQPTEIAATEDANDAANTVGDRPALQIEPD